jgi:hypothetical protein
LYFVGHRETIGHGKGVMTLDYKEGYLYLFRQISEVIDKCKAAQAEAEELVISGSDAPITLAGGAAPEDGVQSTRPP